MPDEASRNETPHNEAKTGRGRPTLENAIERVARDYGRQESTTGDRLVQLLDEAERLTREGDAARAKFIAEMTAANATVDQESEQFKRAARAAEYLRERDHELRGKPLNSLDAEAAEKLAQATVRAWPLVRDHHFPSDIKGTASAINRIAANEPRYRDSLLALNPALLPEVHETTITPLKQLQLWSGRALVDNLRNGPAISAQQHEHSAELDRAAVPEQVTKKFLRDGNKYHFTGGEKALAFVDGGEKLVAKTNNAEVARALVAIAEARGWQEIAVTGTKQFRREAWREATLRGIELRGYEPSEIEKKEIERQLLARSGPNQVKKDERSPEVSPSQVGSDPARATQPTADPGQGKPAEGIVYGTLLEHGTEPLRRQNAYVSGGHYHVKLRLENGQEETFHGDGLKEAIRASRTQPKVGDAVGLRAVGVREVTVMERPIDHQGILLEERPFQRLQYDWVVEQRAYFADATRLERDLAARGLPPANGPSVPPPSGTLELEIERERARSKAAQSSKAEQTPVTRAAPAPADQPALATSTTPRQSTGFIAAHDPRETASTPSQPPTSASASAPESQAALIANQQREAYGAAPGHDVLYGSLLHYGWAQPPKHDKHELAKEPTQYIVLRTGNGHDVTVWGPGLEHALNASQTRPAVGDQLGIATLQNDGTLGFDGAVRRLGTDRSYSVEYTNHDKVDWVLERNAYFANPERLDRDLAARVSTRTRVTEAAPGAAAQPSATERAPATVSKPVPSPAPRSANVIPTGWRGPHDILHGTLIEQGKTRDQITLKLDDGRELILQAPGLQAGLAATRTRPAVGDRVGICVLPTYGTQGVEAVARASDGTTGRTVITYRNPRPLEVVTEKDSYFKESGRFERDLLARAALRAQEQKASPSPEATPAKSADLAKVWREHKGSLEELVKQHPELLDAAAAYRAMVAEMERRPEYKRNPERLEGMKQMLREGYGEWLEQGRKIHAPQIVKSQLRAEAPDRPRAARARADREEAVRAA